MLPTLGAVDAFTILLAGRHPELWPYYAICSTLGSACGASAAYRLARVGAVHRRVKGALIEKGVAFLHRHGSLSLFLAALLPPPFPTSAFVVAAGATHYRFAAFLRSFGSGRACRFLLLAYVASVFGRRFATRMWSTHALIFIAAAGVAAFCVGLLIWLISRNSQLRREPSHSSENKI